MDIFPTFIKLAGGKIPDDRTIDGRDVFAMAAREGEGPHENNPVFWAYGDQRAARRGNFKLLLNARLSFDDAVADQVFLADLAADPSENINLAADHPGLVRELTQLIEAWEKDVMPKKKP